MAWVGMVKGGFHEHLEKERKKYKGNFLKYDECTLVQIKDYPSQTCSHFGGDSYSQVHPSQHSTVPNLI